LLGLEERSQQEEFAQKVQEFLQGEAIFKKDNQEKKYYYTNGLREEMPVLKYYLSIDRERINIDDYDEERLWDINLGHWDLKEEDKEELKEILGKKVYEKYPDKQKFYDQLKLASIVEAEVSDPSDKPKVAGIFIKRLEIDMKLESDAALKYELGRQALRGELKTKETPYNSYKVKGLPPTPIGNPPVETFRAVEKAEVNDDLFFFTYKGKTYYSKTHEEHLKKRRESGQLK